MFMRVTTDMADVAVAPELAGTRVLITGLSPGLGVDLARAFAEQGTRLVIQATENSPEITELGAVPPIPPTHLYYLLTGAGPTMFVLAPECRRLSGLEPTDDDVIEAHADAVCRLLFGED